MSDDPSLKVFETPKGDERIPSVEETEFWLKEIAKRRGIVGEAFRETAEYKTTMYLRDMAVKNALAYGHADPGLIQAIARSLQFKSP